MFANNHKMVGIDESNKQRKSDREKEGNNDENDIGNKQVCLENENRKNNILQIDIDNKKNLTKAMEKKHQKKNNDKERKRKWKWI